VVHKKKKSKARGRKKPKAGKKKKRSHSKKKKSKGKKNKKGHSKKRSNSAASRHMRFTHRLAKQAGLSYSEYIRRRGARERATRARRKGMTDEQLLRDMIKSGQLFGAEEIYGDAGMTMEEGRAADKATLQRDRAATERRAAQGDKQAQAVLARIKAMD
jgi:hypothetical protein